MIRNPKTIGALALFTFVFAITGTASAGLIYWTPAKMGRALVALNYQAPANSFLAAASCKGITKSRHGTFTGFRCAVRYATPAGQTVGTGVVWAKPLPAGRVCASMRGLAYCKPAAAGALPGDPRVCQLNDPAACTLEAAKLAAGKHVGGPGGLYQGPTSCNPVSAFVFSCQLDKTYTVTFTRAAAGWTTLVTP